MRLVLTPANKFEVLGIIHEIEEYGDGKTLPKYHLTRGLQWILDEAKLFLKPLGRLPSFSLAVVSDDTSNVLKMIYWVDERSLISMTHLVIETVATVQRQMARSRPSGERCKTCYGPVESPGGIIDLNADGECDSCAAHREHIFASQEDEDRYGDFDYSMNS